MRKYEIIENYFDDIDTEEKAYWLGFLYADGYNIETKHEVKLRLHIKDEEILIKFRNILFPNKDNPLYYGEFSNGKSKWCELDISNKHISDSLSEKGCVQAKTFKLSFPDFLNENLYNHFIRGLFDGDGCICCSTLKTGEHKTMFSITGYRPFMSQINEIISNSCGLNKNKLIKYKGKDERIATLAFSGCRQCIKIREYLYKDATIYLQRKYLIFFKLGTNEWRTYENLKVNLDDKVIKIKRKYTNNTKTKIKNESLICKNCNKELNYKNKIYKIDDEIYCNKCYIQKFYESKRVKENNIEIINDNISILHIKNKEVLFDTKNIELINKYKWYIEHNRVVSRTRYPKKCIYLNRIIVNAQEGQSVKFIDGNPLNCTESNLEKRNHR